MHPVACYMCERGTPDNIWTWFFRRCPKIIWESFPISASELCNAFSVRPGLLDPSDNCLYCSCTQSEEWPYLSGVGVVPFFPTLFYWISQFYFKSWWSFYNLLCFLFLVTTSSQSFLGSSLVLLTAGLIKSVIVAVRHPKFWPLLCKHTFEHRWIWNEHRHTSFNIVGGHAQEY